MPDATPEYYCEGNFSEFTGMLSFQPIIPFTHPKISELHTQLRNQIIADRTIDEIEELNSDFRWQRMMDLNLVFKLLDAACQNVDRLRETNSNREILKFIEASLANETACVKQFVTTEISLFTVDSLSVKIGEIDTIIKNEIQFCGLCEIRAPEVISLSAEVEVSSTENE